MADPHLFVCDGEWYINGRGRRSHRRKPPLTTEKRGMSFEQAVAAAADAVKHRKQANARRKAMSRAAKVN